jgi:hypothetical protein
MTSSVVYFRDAPSPPLSLSSRPRCRGRRHHSPTSCRRSSSWNCCTYFRLPQHLRRTASLASGLPALSSWVQSGPSPMARALDEVDDRFAFEALPFHGVSRWEWLCPQFVHEGWLPSHRQYSALATPFLWSDGNNLLVFYEELTPRRATSRHVTSCHITSRHSMSCHATSHHVTSCHVTSRHVASGQVRSRHVTSCRVTSRHVTSRHIASHHVTSCYATPRHEFNFSFFFSERWRAPGLPHL